jgi:hypothetical protein
MAMLRHVGQVEQSTAFSESKSTGSVGDSRFLSGSLLFHSFLDQIQVTFTPSRVVVLKDMLSFSLAMVKW